MGHLAQKGNKTEFLFKETFGKFASLQTVSE